MKQFLCLAAVLALAWAGVEDHQGIPQAAPVGDTPGQLVETSPEMLLQESISDQDVAETIVLDPITEGIVHTKIDYDNPLLYNFQAAAATSRSTLRSVQKAAQSRVAELEAALIEVDSTAQIHESTPADGHCLFHACVSGGLFTEADLGFRPTVYEFRRMALSLATPEQIHTAAVSSGNGGMTDAQYIKSMVQGGWGDDLMIALLARCFRKDITVISVGSTRTFRADGTEENGGSKHSIWIAHHSEFHYYGVVRTKQKMAIDDLGRTGGFNGDCPLCTTVWECAVCAWKREQAAKSGGARASSSKQACLLSYSALIDFRP